MLKGRLDNQISAVLKSLEEDVKFLGVDRVNSTMMLRALLEAEESPLYDAIADQLMEDITCFPELVSETYSYVPTQPANAEKSDKQAQITYKDNDGKESKTIFFDDDLRDTLELLIAALETQELVTIHDLTTFFMFSMPTNVIKVLRTFGIDVYSLKKVFIEQCQEKATEEEKPNSIAEKQTFVIPSNLKQFVRSFNEMLKDTTCDISGRDKECQLIWQTLQKKSKRNVVLIGEPGVGKTSIVEKITHDIMNGNCPKEFEDFVVLSVDVNSSIAGTMYRGSAEERFSDLVKFLEKQKNVIVFIDEIHLINGAGACKEGEVDLANSLKPILAGGNVRVIGATTTEEYIKYFSKDGAIKRRFRPITVEEPKMKEVYPMLQKSIKTLSEYHGVAISREMVDFIILNSACFNNETSNPDRTKDLIDLSMVVTKQAGRHRVSKKSVLANFEYNFEMFAKMSDCCKRSTAYHEAGHCLVSVFSENLTNYDVIAVSIMPTDSYLGITVYEKNENTVEPTKEYFVDSIARSLAGRVAEKMFTSTITSGAAADLEEATRTAYDIVSKYGMVEFSMNRIYTEETESERVKNKINTEIDKLIMLAERRAEEILTDNRETLELLVEALMKNGIIGEKELKKLLKGVK